MKLRDIILGGTVFASSVIAPPDIPMISSPRHSSVYTSISSPAYASPSPTLSTELALLEPARRYSSFLRQKEMGQKENKQPGRQDQENQQPEIQPQDIQPPEILPPKINPLEEKIDTYIKGLHQQRYLAQSDRTSIMVYDLVEDKTIVDINADQPRMAASLIKPFVMVAAYKHYSTGGRGGAKRSGTGIDNKVERQLQDMITYRRGVKAANRATNQLIRKIGVRTINQILQDYGFHDTVVREYIPRDDRTYKNTTSAQDLTNLLRRLYQQNMVSGPADAEMLDLLLANHFPSRLRTPAMNGIKIANKTGYVYGLNGDAGIVFREEEQGKERFSAERPYAITVLIEDKSKPYSKQRGAAWGKRRTAVIREVSGMVWEGMGES